MVRSYFKLEISYLVNKIQSSQLMNLAAFGNKSKLLDSRAGQLREMNLEQIIERDIEKERRNVGDVEEDEIDVSHASPKRRVELEWQVEEHGRKVANDIVDARENDHDGCPPFRLGYY